MTVNFTNYFTVFELPLDFDINVKEMRSKFLKLQQQFHPDNFFVQQDKLHALKQSSFINDAYQTLSDELKRAEYLYSLLSQELNSERIKINDPEFLMQQLEQRGQVENLVNNPDFDLYNKLETQAQQELTSYLTQLKQAFATNNLQQVAQLIDKLKFNQKMLNELNLIADKHFA